MRPSFPPRRRPMTLAAKTRVEQLGREEAEFYTSGLCVCGHGRGEHEFPAGPCRHAGCPGCSEFRLKEAA